MKKSGDVLERIVRLLALREIDRIQEVRREENHPNRRAALYSAEEHIQGLLDDLDASQHTEEQIKRLEQSVKIGGTE